MPCRHVPGQADRGQEVLVLVITRTLLSSCLPVVVVKSSRTTICPWSKISPLCLTTGVHSSTGTSSPWVRAAAASDNMPFTPLQPRPCLPTHRPSRCRLRPHMYLYPDVHGGPSCGLLLLLASYLELPAAYQPATGPLSNQRGRKAQWARPLPQYYQLLTTTKFVVICVEPTAIVHCAINLDCPITMSVQPSRLSHKPSLGCTSRQSPPPACLASRSLLPHVDKRQSLLSAPGIGNMTTLVRASQNHGTEYVLPPWHCLPAPTLF